MKKLKDWSAISFVVVTILLALLFFVSVTFQLDMTLYDLIVPLSVATFLILLITSIKRVVKILEEMED